MGHLVLPVLYPNELFIYKHLITFHIILYHFLGRGSNSEYPPALVHSLFKLLINDSVYLDLQSANLC